MVTELVALSPDGEEFRGRGVLEGEIADRAPRHGGFGYDPIFVPAGEARTVAELGDEWKAATRIAPARRGATRGCRVGGGCSRRERAPLRTCHS